MRRTIASRVAVVLLASACATTAPQHPAPQATAATTGGDQQPAPDRAACGQHARAGLDPGAVRTVVEHGALGMFLLALIGAADGAHAAALTGGSAGEGAWIGAAAGAGIGLVIGFIAGWAKARDARTQDATGLDSCLAGRDPPTNKPDA